ncbi:MAG TPA: PASTA domain-containing protein, partial [Candidatus Hydrogenedentes bacterium]|nr:PASTA domain-containing protein [Candidatus Hydrogenedentota bacterium]
LVVGQAIDQCSDSVPAGQVISTDPQAGAQVTPGTVVQLTVSTGVPCPPPNDDCVNAIVIDSDVAVIGSNVNATGTTTSSCCYQDYLDVWYSWTPLSDGYGIVDTFGNATNMDTSLVVYDSCNGTALGCNDDYIGHMQSHVAVPVVAGHTYLIRVAGYNNTVGTFELLARVLSPVTVPDVTGWTVTDAMSELESAPFYTYESSVCSNTVPVGHVIRTDPPAGSVIAPESVVLVYQSTGTCPPPENDVCMHAIILTSNEYYYGNNLSATGTDITSCGSADAGDVWYIWTPEADGIGVVDTNHSATNFDTTLAVFDTCDGTQLACNDDYALYGSNSRVIFPVVANQSYLIRVAGYHMAEGNFVLYAHIGNPATVPDLNGMDLNTATATLQSAGFQAGITTEICDAAPAGVVIAQSPAGGALEEEGANVDIYISSGSPCP